jgi:outer membrane lipoprotein SlyB
MSTRFKIVAVAAVLAVSTSSVAMARYPCVPGYTYRHGVCQPVHPQGYSNPVSGAVSGEAAGAARGNASAGPVGAVVGGALGTASGALTGTANMLTPSGR